MNSLNKASFFKEALFNSNQTYIHPTSILGEEVQIDSNVKIGPFCVLTGNIKIASGTKIYSNVAIGFPAQNIGTQKSLGSIIIGKNCHIREFATIHSSKYENGKTIVGNNCYIMNYAHVSHDSILQDNVILTNNASIGGHTLLEKNVILMGYSATHQFCKIGQLTAVAPYSATRQDLPPFCIFNGQPAGFAGLNLVGLKKAGLKSENIRALKQVTKLFYVEKLLINDVEKQIKSCMLEQDPYVQYFINFIKTSDRGVSRALHFSKINKGNNTQ